jgi:hypothetical protein
MDANRVDACYETPNIFKSSAPIATFFTVIPVGEYRDSGRQFDSGGLRADANRVNACLYGPFPDKTG